MGFFSKKKKSANAEIDFMGAAGQASTIKCLLLAGIRGVALNVRFVSDDIEPDHLRSYQYLSGNEKAPTLTQDDFSVSGARAIQTYLDIRGKGASLYPRKARVLGQQNYWIEVGYRILAPAVEEVVNGDAGDQARARCHEVLSRLNDVLGGNQFVAGPLSLADHNVAAYIYVLRTNGMELEQYSGITAWLARLEGEMASNLRDKYLSLLTSTAGEQAA